MAEPEDRADRDTLNEMLEQTEKELHTIVFDRTTLLRPQTPELFKEPWEEFGRHSTVGRKTL